MISKRNFILLLGLFLTLVTFSSCAVKDYPREVTSKERVQTNAAYVIDTASARSLCALYKPIFSMDKQIVQINYDYYLDPAFRENPRSFYPAPDGPPEFESITKFHEQDGVELFLMKWKSKYVPQNPEFVKYYEMYPETHDVFAVYAKSKNNNKGAIVVSHGWTGKDVTKEYKTQHIVDYAKMGFDSILVQQPYHGLRRPADSAFSGEYFFSAEVSRTNEAFCQTVTDARTAYLWLRENYEVVGARGGSLGGITTLLLAANEPGLDFAVSWVPPSDIGAIPADGALAHFVLRGMENSGLDQKTVKDILFVSDPANFGPLVPKKDILIIAGMGDNFVPVNHPLSVWQAWDNPSIHWFAGGHAVNYQEDECRRIEADFMLERLALRVDNID